MNYKLTIFIFVFWFIVLALSNENSDIDILVEFEAGETPGLITFCGLENKLSELIGRKVDLRTAGDLSHYFRDEVINHSEIQYVNK
jgi:hypothetical protein